MKRYQGNPIICVDDIGPSNSNFKVLGVFNPGVTTYGGETLLLLRVAETPICKNDGMVASPIFDESLGQVIVKSFNREDPDFDFSDPRIITSSQQSYLTSMSHIRIARSSDHYHFKLDAQPFIMATNEYEAFGVEDPRVTQIEDTYYICYSAASNAGIVTRLASTKDFRQVTKLGNMFHPDNKDVAIFPKKINGSYFALHRPSTSDYGKPEIWLAQSSDLVYWGNHQRLVEVRPTEWDSARIGAGAVPFLTPKGWIEIYHGATADNQYCLGALLLDADKPWVVLARSQKPLVEPTAAYETSGFFGNVVFTCGALVDDGLVRVYYGASDDSVCCLELTVDEIFENLGI